MVAPWSGPMPVRAQATEEESSEAATAGLFPLLMPDAEAPAGYTFDFTRAFDNAAATLEHLTVEPTDPRQPGEILGVYESAGRVVRLLQGLEPVDPDSAAGLRVNTILFRTPEGAARALQDPSLALFVTPLEQVTPMDAPALGEGSAGFRVDYRGTSGELEDRANAVVWRQGRLAFSVLSYGTPEQADAAMPLVLELARKQQARVAALPTPPATFGAPPAGMPAAQARVEWYRQLADRVLPDEAAGANLESQGVSSISNAIMVLDARDAAPSLQDPMTVVDRLLAREHRVVGVSKSYQPVEGMSDPPDTRFPDISVGYHLYADAAGATEALAAPTDEIALRMSEEIAIGDSRDVQLADVAIATQVGDQMRALGGAFTTTDAEPITLALVSIRWRRGPVELFVDVAALPTIDMTALTAQLVEQLDATYAANPLPGV